MPIRTPRPVLSGVDKKLILLLGRLITEGDTTTPGSNLGSGRVSLSDTEAEELLALLQQYMNTRSFLEASSFVEGVVSTKGETGERQMRELYLSARKIRGRARALASKQWAEFQLRLGVGRVSVTWRSEVPRMDSEYFLAMERKLLETLKLDPRVVTAVMTLIQQRTETVDQLRDGNRPLKRGVVRASLQKIVDTLVGDRKLAVRELATTQLVGAITIVSDVGILFTTRDWGVAGTLSTLAGAAISTGRK